jgi:hypothetical protein
VYVGILFSRFLLQSFHLRGALVAAVPERSPDHQDRGALPVIAHALDSAVAKSLWSDDTVLAAMRARVLPIIERCGPIRALIIDDTGMPSAA